MWEGLACSHFPLLALPKIALQLLTYTESHWATAWTAKEILHLGSFCDPLWQHGQVENVLNSSWMGDSKCDQQRGSGEEAGLMTLREAQRWQENGCWGGANSLRNEWETPALGGCMQDTVLHEASYRSLCLDVKWIRRTAGEGIIAAFFFFFKVSF